MTNGTQTEELLARALLKIADLKNEVRILRRYAPLRDPDVERIRERFDGGQATIRQLAREYHTTPSNMHSIVHRSTWKHLK